MKILMVGGGGREHALLWKLSQSPRVSALYCAPGNGGIAGLARCVDIAATDIDGVVAFAKENRVDWVFVAPDDPLALGMVDAVQAAGIKAFGPRKNAAILEGSKVFAKALMQKYRIPTARYEVFDDVQRAEACIRSWGGPVVVKADGLALGKGVFVTDTVEEALAAVRAIMVDRAFGPAGSRVIIEERLSGPEVSMLCFTDGKTVRPMVSSQDHKRVRDGDQGPNTGGMGAFAPSPHYTPDVAREVLETIIRPTVRAMAAEGRPFRGVLYVGLMLTDRGPRVLEYNARFGDPEAQVVLPLLKTDLLDIMDAIEARRLDEIDIAWHEGAAVTVVMASGGYPGPYEKGKLITGLENVADALVFHAGTKKTQNGYVTSGGRVLAMTGLALTLQEAAGKAYRGVAAVSFEGAQYRTDIARNPALWGPERKFTALTEQETIRAMIEKRRTFAIISHPDAGKTTLTEKLLLYGGAIHLAGSVKSRKAARYAVSDWMEIEKQRGISVTSSVMQFNYGGYVINILDAPGHQDFSEDTYRTLVAADSAVMLIDGARGVEPQTIQLFKVCRMRGIPIFTFVNKMDRAAKDPFALMAEIEGVLGISACPINWPIGTEGDFVGLYHRASGQVELYEDDHSHGARKLHSRFGAPEDPDIAAVLGSYRAGKLQDDIDLLEGAGDRLDLDLVHRGELTPMFFGSAINNFGVESFLDAFLAMTRPPGARLSDAGPIAPDRPDFSAFVFKIQANMNPAHRDRLAFLRICSGRYEKNMEVLNVQSGKRIRLTQPRQFLAQNQEAVSEAWPGDIIGVFDPGVFSLGDTLLTGGEVFRYEGIPMFSPEHFARVAPTDSLKRKQFVKGVTQLSQEGAVQVFRQPGVGREELLAGVVGVLQLDVLSYRLEGEYGVPVRVEPLPYCSVRWVGEGSPDIDGLKLTSTTMRALDQAGRPVLLFENSWSIDWALKNNPGLVLSETAPRAEME